MIVIIIAVVILALDQLSKVWVMDTLKEVRDIPVLDGILHWHYAENTGAAFSMMNDVNWFPILVAVIAGLVAIFAVVYVFTRKYKMHWLEMVSIGLVVGGAIGNQIDRLRFGFVIDFIYVKLINFAIFNIADSALVVGAIALSVYILFIHEKYVKQFADAPKIKDIPILAEATNIPNKKVSRIMMKNLKTCSGICDIRLDKVVSNEANISRSLAAKLISNDNVLVNGAVKKSSYIVTADDEITIEIPESKSVDITPQDIPLDIVFEDKHIIVINKPRNLVVHPSPGHEDMTLVNGLLFHCNDIEGIGAEQRPGIVHRIDKDTTGLLVIAKNDKAMQSLSEQIANRTVKRKYKALVEGVIKEGGCVVTNMGRSHMDRKKQAVVKDGRYAKTNYRIEKTFKQHTLLDVALETGRTHQIRVHMAYLNHPIVGDKLYGYKKSKFSLDGQLLHAYLLEFIHPHTGKPVKYTAPLPQDFKRIIDVLEKRTNP